MTDGPSPIAGNVRYWADGDTAPTVIVSIQPSGHIDYGPPGETWLDITLIDEHGTPFPVIIQGKALLRLAAIVRDIDARGADASGNRGGMEGRRAEVAGLDAKEGLPLQAPQ